MYDINMDELEDDTKIQCPRCADNGNDKSHDNLHFYSKELGAHCFSCSLTIPSEEYKNDYKAKGDKKLIKESDLKKLAEKSFTEQQLKDFQSNTVSEIDIKWRGLDNSVCKKLGVRWSIDKDGLPTAMHYPATIVGSDGVDVITGYKSRAFPKDFYSTGYVGKCSGFFGQTKAIADTLIVVAGENDLITAISAMENADKYRKSYNVVSSPLGEDSTAQMIKLNYEWVNAHKKIIVCMDNDEAGEAAFNKVKEVIDSEKLFKGNLEFNDINDYLKYGKGSEIANAIYWSALPLITYGISGSGSIYKEMLEMATQEKIDLPPFLSDLKNIFVGGIGLSEIITVTSPPSLGKTSIVNQWIIDWLMTCRYRIFIVSIEDSAASFGMKIASKILGINIAGMETAEEKVKVLTENKEKIDEYLYTKSGENRFDILSKIPSNVEDLKAAIIHAIKVHGSRILIIDPLSAVLASMSNEQQVELMAFFEQIKRDHSCTVILCLHTRKSGSGQKDVSEGAEYGESDIRGSSAIPATATINILLSRNKFAEDEIEKNTTNISVSKHRSQGNTGRNVAKIYYSKEHSTLFSYNYALENNFFKDVTPEDLKRTLDSNKATEVVGTEIDDVEVFDVF